MQISRVVGIAGASAATGAVVVIDTFRAFTTAAVLLARGVSELVLTADLDDARATARELDALLCGEDHGRTPDDFDLGNSPAAAGRRSGLEGRTVVQRTTAGTRSVVAALENGATPVYAASLVVASATASAVRNESRLTIVGAGLHGTERAEEDELTGDLIADLLAGRGDPGAIGRAVARCDRAAVLSSARWADAGDVPIATDVDRFDFAMRATRAADGRVRLAVDRHSRPPTRAAVD